MRSTSDIVEMRRIDVDSPRRAKTFPLLVQTYFQATDFFFAIAAPSNRLFFWVRCSFRNTGLLAPSKPRASVVRRIFLALASTALRLLLREKRTITFLSFECGMSTLWQMSMSVSTISSPNFLPISHNFYFVAIYRQSFYFKIV